MWIRVQRVEVGFQDLGVRSHSAGLARAYAIWDRVVEARVRFKVYAPACRVRAGVGWTWLGGGNAAHYHPCSGDLPSPSLLHRGLAPHSHPPLHPSS